MLPPWLGGFKAAATVRVARSGLLELDSASIGPIGFGIPPLRIQDLKIAYRGGAWYGQIKLCVAENVCIDATPEKGGGVQIGPGEFFSVAANVTFPGRGLPLFSEVYLRSIHAGVSHPPLRLIGGADVTAAGGLIELDGTLAFAFASPSAPYRLQTDRARLGNRFQPADYPRDFTVVHAWPPAPPRTSTSRRSDACELGGGHFLYSHDPGYIAFGGGIDTDFLGVLRITGGVSGQINLEDGRFNLHGRVDSCIADIPLLDNLCWGSVGNVSTIGAGACVEVGPFQVGGGVRFAPWKVFLWPLDGCKWSQFRDDNVARAAQAGGRVIRTRRGDPSRAIELRGDRRRPARARHHQRRHDARQHRRVGACAQPTDPDPALRAAEADRRRAHRPRARRASHRAAARLARDHRLRPGLRPTRRARQRARHRPRRHPHAHLRHPQTRRPDGPLLRSRPRRRAASSAPPPSGRGRLRFTPAPGRGRSRIEARFELAGLAAETLHGRALHAALAEARAPLASARRAHGGTLRVSWKRVPDATGYDVRVRLTTGGERNLHVTTTNARMRGIPRHSTGRISVRASAPARRGAAGTARLRAVGPRPKTRIGPLTWRPR